MRPLKSIFICFFATLHCYSVGGEVVVCRPGPIPALMFHCFDGIHCLDPNLSVCSPFYDPQCPDDSDQNATLCKRYEPRHDRFSCCDGKTVALHRICDGVCDCDENCDDEDVCKGAQLDRCPSFLGPITIIVLVAIIITVIVLVVLCVLCKVFHYSRILQRFQAPSATPNVAVVVTSPSTTPIAMTPQRPPIVNWIAQAPNNFPTAAQQPPYNRL